MIINRLNGSRDTNPKQWEGEWLQFRKEVVGFEHTYYSGDKLQSPAFTPARYPEGATRALRNVLDVQLAVYDYDQSTLREIKAISDRLTESNVQHLVYSSYSYQGDPDHAKARIVINLSRPVAAQEWPIFWAYVASILGGEPDAACKDASRLFFLACTPNLEDAFMWAHDHGEPLDVAEMLQAAYASGITTTGVASSGEGRGASAVGRDVNIDRDMLKTHIKHLAAKRNGRDQITAALLRSVADGEPYAEEGSRHDTLKDITNHLTYQWPTATVDSVVELFDASHRRMYPTSTERDAANNDARILAEGAKGLMARKSEAKREAEDNNGKAIMRSVFAPVQPGREHPYTTEEVAEWAAERGVSLQDLSQLWLILFGSAVYHFVGGVYLPPYNKDASKIQSRKDLLPATTVGVALQKPTETGEWVDVPFEKLVERYGSTALKATASLIAQRTTYDASTRTIVEAVRPRRVLTAQRSPLVEQWLTLLAGTPEMLAVLNGWLAEVRKLERPLAALYLQGAPGTGKTMFANGLARLWGTSGPTRADDVTGEGFNEVIVNNPVIFADEYLPSAWTGKQGLARFREFIVSRTRSLSRKYIPSVPLEGCVRVLVAANNQDLLKSGDMTTPEDRAAIAERLCHVKIGSEAARFLAQQPRDVTAHIWTGDEFARHVVWLEETYASPWAKLRFGVPHEGSELHETLKLNHPVNEAVAQWLIMYVLDPSRVTGRAVRIEDGMLFVHWTAMADQDAWRAYVSNPREVPPSRALQNALGEFSDSKVRRRLGTQDYRVVKLDELVAAATKMELGSREQLSEALARKQIRPSGHLNVKGSV